MMPEPLPPYAALARTRTVSHRAETAAADSSGSFADEMSGPSAAQPEDHGEDDRDDDKANSLPEPTSLLGQTPLEAATSAGNGTCQAIPVPQNAGGVSGEDALSPAAFATDGIALTRDGTPQTLSRAGLSGVATAVPASVALTAAMGAQAGSRVEPGAEAAPDGPELDAAEPAAGAAPAAATADAAGKTPPVAQSRTAPGDAVAFGIAPASTGAAKGWAASEGERDPAASAGGAGSGDGASGTSGPGHRDAASATGPAPGDPRSVPVAGAEPGGTGAGPDGGGVPDRSGTDTAGVSPQSGADRAGAALAEAARAADPRGTAPQTIGSQIVDGIRQARDGSIEIALSPEELGSLRMTITGDDLTLHVRIHADRPETEGLLRRHIALLQQDFRDLGYGQVAFDFGPRQDQPARYPTDPQADAGPAIEVEPVSAPAAPPLRTGGTPVAGRGLDIRL